MRVQMRDGLSAIRARVGDKPEAVRQAFLLGYLRSGEHQVTQQRSMRLDCVGSGCNMFLRDNKNMRRSNSMKITKRQAPLVLKHLGGWDRTGNNTAEDAVSSHA